MSIFCAKEDLYLQNNTHKSLAKSSAFTTHLVMLRSDRRVMIEAPAQPANKKNSDASELFM